MTAIEMDDKGQWVPVDGLEVLFYIPRTFRLLKVGKGTITAGVTTVDFPVSLPGNQQGHLTLLSKVEDHEINENVKVSGTINWEKPILPVKEINRGLGDTNAPLWMVYTLIVLLSLVWIHYLSVVITIFRIRYHGK